MCQNNDMRVYIFCPRMLERRFLREPGRDGEVGKKEKEKEKALADTKGRGRLTEETSGKRPRKT